MYVYIYVGMLCKHIMYVHALLFKLIPQALFKIDPQTLLKIGFTNPNLHSHNTLFWLKKVIKRGITGIKVWA